MTDEEIADQLTEMRATLQQMGEALVRALAPIGQALVRFWQRIVAWIQRQGILSPAYAYASPAMRRRAARQRAHLAMRAKNRRV